MEKIFENKKQLLAPMKKKQYRENMEGFRGAHEPFFRELLKSVNEAEDKEARCRQIAEEMYEAAVPVFSKRGKMKGTDQLDCNFFMIYYVFPIIQLIGNEDSILLCDIILDKWHTGFKKNEGLKYMDYEGLYNSFNEKIFGIF